MKSNLVGVAMFLVAALAAVDIASRAARPAFAEPGGDLPPIFRAGGSVVGVRGRGAPEPFAVLEVRGKWIHAQGANGLEWIAPETWNRWSDAAGPGGPAATLALTQMATFGAAINLWKMSRRSLPATLEDLTRPDAGTGQPYIESGKIPLDPWGKPYEFHVIDERRMRYEISTAGPDKLLGTDDDVYYPERR